MAYENLIFGIHRKKKLLKLTIKYFYFLDVQVGLDMGRLIQQSRSKAKLSQKDLAAVNEHYNTFITHIHVHMYMCILLLLLLYITHVHVYIIIITHVQRLLLLLVFPCSLKVCALKLVVLDLLICFDVLDVAVFLIIVFHAIKFLIFN